MSYRYLGNKTRLLPTILRKVQELCPVGSVVADPMTGTASVAACMRHNGYRVIAADQMTYSVQHARVRLLQDGPPPFDEISAHGYGDIIRALNKLPPEPGFFHQEYSAAGKPANGAPPRMYLNGENAGRIDAIRAQIASWSHDGMLTRLEEDLLKHDLVLATNRVANIAGTYGHYRSTFGRAAERPLALVPTEFSRSPLTTPGKENKVLHGRVEDLASDIEADLCYLDPPYIKRQYAANYHLLETLARGDSPEPEGASGLRPWRDQYSDFCSKRRLRSAFRQVLDGVQARMVLVSYSEDGLAEADQLFEIFGAYGRVSLDRLRMQRFRSSSYSGKAAVEEYLFTIEMAPELVRQAA